MRTYNVFVAFLIFSSCLIRINTMHNQNPWAKFSRGNLTFPPLMFPLEKKDVKFYYCNSIELRISVERVRETEKNATFPGSVGHICQEK